MTEKTLQQPMLHGLRERSFSNSRLRQTTSKGPNELFAQKLRTHKINDAQTGIISRPSKELIRLDNDLTLTKTRGKGNDNAEYIKNLYKKYLGKENFNTSDRKIRTEAKPVAVVLTEEGVKEPAPGRVSKVDRRTTNGQSFGIHKNLIDEDRKSGGNTREIGCRIKMDFTKKNNKSQFKEMPFIELQYDQQADSPQSNPQPDKHQPLFLTPRPLHYPSETNKPQPSLYQILQMTGNDTLDLLCNSRSSIFRALKLINSSRQALLTAASQSARQLA